MKALVVYYTRTGTTQKVAEDLMKHFEYVDQDGILDLTKREGAINYLKAGRDAYLGNTTEISEPQKDPSNYDLVVFGSPVWAGNLAPAMRTYMRCHKDKFGHVACYCTMGGSNPGKVFSQMKEELGKEPLATLHLTTKEVKKNMHHDKLKEFAEKIHKHKKIKKLSSKKQNKKTRKKKK
jgi:flavodoxin